MVAASLIETARGVFDTLVGGPAEGPALLMLHGFPQTNETWRQHLPELVDRGFRVIAPNQRGYGRSVRTGSFATREPGP